MMGQTAQFLFQDNIRTIVRQQIVAIEPFDDLEKQHIDHALSWVDSGAEIFRIQKPNIPDKHLVSYFVVVDMAARQILLVDHKKAQLWLPTAGLVEINEHPRATVMRECQEELGVDAVFMQDQPFFLTVTQTVGLTAGHTDVSLWYVLKGQTQASYLYDQNEFETILWFGFDGVPFHRADPHLRRFIDKLSCYTF